MSLHIAVFVGLLGHLELADATADEEYDGDAAEPPCQRNTRSETGYDQEYAPDRIADDV